MMAAIARDIINGVGSGVLELWRRKVLSCTATFQVHATELERYRVAVQLREHDHPALSRANLQLVYEIQREFAAELEIAAARSAKACELLHFVAIHGRLLEIRDAERLLVEMDSTLAMEENSFLRLRAALVSKCGNSMELSLIHI